MPFDQQDAIGEHRPPTPGVVVVATVHGGVNRKIRVHGLIFEPLCVRIRFSLLLAL